MRRARIAITAVFALNGTMFASLFARLPAIQERASIGDGELGLALLCAMLGLLSVQAVAGALVSRFGSRPVVVGSAIGYALGLVPVALSTSLRALAASMLLIGMASGPLDVAMNVHGLTIERLLGRPILSGLHAAFSFGALGGAAAGGVIAGVGVGVVTHLSVVAALGTLLALGLRLLLPSGRRRRAGGRSLRPAHARAGAHRAVRDLRGPERGGGERLGGGRPRQRGRCERGHRRRGTGGLLAHDGHRSPDR
jgi:MFS family permease